jgi:glycosyltransferase involved in cell wall biosynthesis
VVRYQRFSDALRNSDAVLAPSQFVADAVHANGLDDLGVRVLPLGVESFESVAPSHAFPQEIHLGYVGPLIPAKGLDLLLEAIRRIDDPRFRLLVFGRDDVDAAYTRRIVRRSARDRRISLMGPFQPGERGRVYGDMDLVIIASRVPESFSLVAREALQAGVPVLAADIGALPEVIHPGVNGDLFVPGDPGSLEGKLRESSEDPDSLRHMVVGKTSGLLSAEAHIGRLQAIYAEAASETRAA